MAQDQVSNSPNAQAGLLAQRLRSPRQLRTELQSLVVKELLGPRGGPVEEFDERPRDRYLIGMLAAKNKLIPAAEMDALAEDGEASGEDGATDDTPPAADSLFPSSIGLTCTVDGQAEQLLVTARWRRYLGEKSETLTTEKGNPAVVWKRYPKGNIARKVPLAEGDLAAPVLDPNQPEVYLQGQVRRLEGDWIVSLFW